MNILRIIGIFLAIFFTLIAAEITAYLIVGLIRNIRDRIEGAR